MEDDPKDYVPEKPGPLFYLSWVLAVVVVSAAMGGFVLARNLKIQSQTTERVASAKLGRRVLVTRVSRTPPSRTVRLPADIHGYIESPVYAKIPGYLKTIQVDKGDRVKKGQLLAILASPEIDRQVNNAEADLHIKILTDRRYQYMARHDAASQQQADQTRADMLQSKANLGQMRAMQAYEQIRSDFDGVVTARYVDPGTLITQTTASTGTNPQPIVMMATLRPLRIYSFVPQSVAPFIKDGDAAAITVYEYPGREFKGTVTRHSNALSTSTRTMQVEVDLPNQSLDLYPGMYATASFKVSIGENAPMVPDDALIFRDGRAFVPVVKNDRLHVVEVGLGYDNGRMIVITRGLAGDEMVAVNVGQTAHDGDTVQPVMMPEKNQS